MMVPSDIRCNFRMRLCDIFQRKSPCRYHFETFHPCALRCIFINPLSPPTHSDIPSASDNNVPNVLPSPLPVIAERLQQRNGSWERCTDNPRSVPTRRLFHLSLVSDHTTLLASELSTRMSWHTCTACCMLSTMYNPSSVPIYSMSFT